MDQVAKLEAERSSLEKTCMELKQKTEQLERRAAELRAAEEKRHQEELMALKKTNAQLKARDKLYFIWLGITESKCLFVLSATIKRKMKVLSIWEMGDTMIIVSH